MSKKISRRKFLYTGAAAGLAVLGGKGFSESNHPHLVKIDIPLSRLPHSFDGFTIAQLSDFHYEEHFSAVPIRKSVDMVNQLRPDLIVLTGDFVTVPFFASLRQLQQAAATAAPCAALLQQLNGPKFAIIGNHDAVSAPEVVIAALEAHGIPVLVNMAIPLERGGKRIWLAGVDDVLKGEPDLGAAVDSIPNGEATILLAHEPDFADESSLRSIDLQLSGHSHGGQIWIPGIGAPWLPELARQYPRGLYKIDEMVLYTNIGIGTIRAPIRINCPPEVTLITLRSKAKS